MFHDLIDEKYLEGPINWSSPDYDNYNWIAISDESHVKFDEIVQWCLKNCISKFSWGYKYINDLMQTEYGFIFQNIYDAMAFKLMWS